MLLKRTAPAVTDGFLLRMCYALRIEPKAMAKALDMPLKEFMELVELDRAKNLDLDRNEVGWTLMKFVAEEIGYLLAVKTELDRKLQKDRAARALRIQQQRDAQR